MPGNTNKVDDPCDECRSRHLKCDNDRPKCANCTRTNQKCNRTKGIRKFRDGSSAQYEKQFSKDQVWIGLSKHAKIQIVDQTPELENFYSVEDSEALKPPPRPRSSHELTDTNPFVKPSITSHPQSAGTSPARASFGPDALIRSPSSINSVSIDSLIQHDTNKRRRTNEDHPGREIGSSAYTSTISKDLQKSYVVRDGELNTLSPTNQYAGFGSPNEFMNEARRIEAEYQRLNDTEAAKIPPEPFLSPDLWKKEFFWPNQLTTLQCVCLFRYFLEHLGPWFDVGDPTRQFTHHVPQRARRCPPLLNAIFTAAAVHIRYMHKKNNQRTVRFMDKDLPNLDQIATIKYYQATISYLRVLANNDNHARDEDLLAATVILRYYEDLEASISGEDHGGLSRPFSLFVAAQARPAFLSQLPYSVFDFSLPGSFDNIRFEAEAYLKGYQHASFRIALRQECASALLARKPVSLPLDAWSLLDSFDETEDSVWTDRHLHHYAKVLTFCFGEQEHGKSAQTRWEQLKEFEEKWEKEKPMTFAPFHVQEPDKQHGTVFPEIWYVGEVHSTAFQYYHMSRVLLTIYNPFIPRIGPGSAAAARKLSIEVRSIIIQLCGIAMSRTGSQPALVMAYNAIAMFGEHFTNRLEQQALLSVLTELEDNHGWPTSTTADNLKNEWAW